MALRLLFLFVWFLFSGSASAIGLGELKTQPVLGDRLHLEIDILGATKEMLSDSCYRLGQPPGGGEEIPWLSSAVVNVRKGAPPVLEIRSTQALHDPVMAVAVYVGCGQEVVREYMLLASPPRESTAPEQGAAAHAVADRPAVRKELKVRQPGVTDAMPPVQRAPQRRVAPPPIQIAAAAAPDRLMLSAGGEFGETGLQLSAELSSVELRQMAMPEAQREMLRLEFRMMMALQEQALNQLEAGEKLRNLDGALSELQRQVNHSGKDAALQSPAPVAPAAAIPRAPASVPHGDAAASWQEVWAGYIAVLAAFAGIAGWLLWRSVQERRLRASLQNDYLPISPVAPEDESEHVTVERMHEGVAAEPLSETPLVHVDLPLDEAEPPCVDSSTPEQGAIGVAAGEIEPAAVNPHFDANPVMELADVMLSFGRVKGAAQALQEYIDANPKEALQPWMRLLDVYRMAGMRAEFEALALNLNKNFNVEIQHWAPATETDHVLDFVVDDVLPASVSSPRTASLEDIPRIMQQVIERWSDADVGEYLQQLLRDNRGGARLGFPIGVVEEILFLIDLKAMIVAMEQGNES